MDDLLVRFVLCRLCKNPREGVHTGFGSGSDCESSSGFEASLPKLMGPFSLCGRLADINVLREGGWVLELLRYCREPSISAGDEHNLESSESGRCCAYPSDVSVPDDLNAKQR